MKDKILEQKKIIKIGCWKYKKFINSEEPEEAKCPHGFMEINPLCKYCIWFEVKKVAWNKKPIVTDREIGMDDVDNLRLAYSKEQKLSNAIPIDAESVRDNGIH